MAHVRVIMERYDRVSDAHFLFSHRRGDCQSYGILFHANYDVSFFKQYLIGLMCAWWLNGF